MKTERFDVVIIGARAAGASTAMLLARRGVSVLVIDKQRYGSDTLSTHALMRGAVDSLHRWGLLDKIVRTTPTIRRTEFRYADTAIDVKVKSRPGVPGLVAPRRTVLDPVLVDGARVAGAELRYETTLDSLLRDATGRVRGVHVRTSDGNAQIIHAGVVIGADGLRSKVARLVRAPITHQGSSASAYIMRYVTGLDLADDAYRWSYNIGTGTGVIPTNNGQHVVFAAMPQERFVNEGRANVEAVFGDVLAETDPELSQAMQSATGLDRFRSWPGVPGFFRKPQGAGWALVGDAGYFKDPFAAHGISDAFRDAELLSNAVCDGTAYETVRNQASFPLFMALESIASYDWDLDSLPKRHVQMARAMKNESAVLAGLRSEQRQAAPSLAVAA